MDNFYEEKVRELTRIIEKQETIKRGLERDISVLVKESTHQKHFVEHWRQQLSENIEVHPISHHQQLINSAYLIPSPLVRTEAPKKEIKKNRAPLFRSANLHSRLLK